LSRGEVWVLHLREREMMGKTGLMTSAESSDEAGADVSAAVEALTRAGIKAHGVVRDTAFGHAAREIVSDAAEHGVDVIVMGSRGRGDLAGLVLGCTAHTVIHLADRPVLGSRADTRGPVGRPVGPDGPAGRRLPGPRGAAYGRRRGSVAGYDHQRAPGAPRGRADGRAGRAPGQVRAGCPQHEQARLVGTLH